ncbi:MAG TPA: hypothetical protein VFC67_27300 [Prolixibacteraceae bacterium]|nr:hypothetical protein [Prolixibacteraceae bacterium]
MQKILAAEALKKSIQVTERRQMEEGKLLREQFTDTFESLKPINILRKMLTDIAEPSALKETLIQTVTGLMSGYISRKLFVRSSKNPLLRLAGVLVQYGVANFVAKNSDSIKALGLYYINKLSSRSSD